VRLIIAHIAGIPIEESLVMAVPVLGAMYVALIASFRARRSGKRD
jgi:hypothetical protein